MVPGEEDLGLGEARKWLRKAVNGMEGSLDEKTAKGDDPGGRT